MLRLFKKKYVYPELKWPSCAREMTEYEKRFVVNGGKTIGNSIAEQAEAEEGDILIDDAGNEHVLGKGDIKWAKDKMAERNGTTATTPPSTGGSGSSGSGSGSGSTGNTPSSPSSSNNTNDTTSNTVKGPNHRSAYDQQYINEMMEKDRKKAMGGNGIQGNAVAGKKVEEKEIKVNPGAGNMTVSDYIAEQRKLGTGTTVSGQTVGGEVAGGISGGETVDPRNRGFTLTTDNYPDAYKTKEKTADEKVKEAVAKIGKKDYIVGEYQCDQYVNEIVEKAGYDPKDFYLDDPSGKTVDKHISDLIASGKSYSTSASSLLPGSYVVFMSDDDKVKNSHAALLVVENGSAYIQDNSSHNNATAWNEYGKAIAWAGGTEKTLDISATAVCNQFTGYENFYFQRII